MNLLCKIFGHLFEIHEDDYTCGACGSDIGSYHKKSDTCLRCGKKKK